jgi:hypothetical protein
MPASPAIMSAKILIASVVGVLIQFALAIVGWGGWRPFFAHPALRALAWATAALTVLAAFTEASVSSGEKEDRGNRWVLPAFGVIALLLSYFSAYTDRIGFWTLDGDTLRWMSLVVFSVGGLLRILPVFVLGRRFSGLVAIQPGHTLETRGMYSVIRNPSYLGLLTSSRLGAILPLRGGRAAGGVPAGAAGRPHARRRAPAAPTLRRRVRRLPRPHLAPPAARLLMPAAKRKWRTARPSVSAQRSQRRILQRLRLHAIRWWLGKELGGFGFQAVVFFPNDGQPQKLVEPIAR